MPLNDRDLSHIDCFLSRNHDIRMTLNHYEVLKPDDQLYHTVNRLTDTLTLSNTDDCTIKFVPRTKDWNVHFIRHKQRHSYILDDMYTITISQVREYVPDWSRAMKDEPLEVTPDLYNVTHMEVEVWVFSI